MLLDSFVVKIRTTYFEWQRLGLSIDDCCFETWDEGPLLAAEC